jgi:hypothetical protein
LLCYRLIVSLRTMCCFSQATVDSCILTHRVPVRSLKIDETIAPYPGALIKRFRAIHQLRLSASRTPPHEKLDVDRFDYRDVAKSIHDFT